MTILTATIAAITAPGAEAWRIPIRPARSEWCERNLRVPKKTAARPGRIRLDGPRAYWREIVDAVDDPDVREIVIPAVPQLGKTTVSRAIVLSQGEVDRAPMLFSGPNKVYAQQERANLYAMAEASPVLRERIPPPHRRNDRVIDLDRCLIHLGWSGSTQTLSGRSCKKVIVSEGDRFSCSPDFARQRVNAFPASSTVIYEGSVVGSASTLWTFYQSSDRRTFHVPCPHCGHHQELRFFPHRRGDYAGCGGIAGIKNEAGEYLTPEQARKGAYYLCERGCRITDDDKPAMIAAGRWVPEGQRMTPDGKLVGRPANPGRRRGYHLSALYSPAQSFGDLAEYFLLKRDEPLGMERFWNDVIGKPYKPRGKTPRWQELGRRLAGSHARGEVPAWAYFLVGAGDVQEDHAYWQVWGFGDRCTSALVDFGLLTRPAGETGRELNGDLDQLDRAVLERRWPVTGENPMGYRHLAVARFGLDSGYRLHAVLAFVRAHPGDRVLAIAGDPKPVPGVPYRPQILERNTRTGEVYPEGSKRWVIDTSGYKTDVMDRWHADLRAPGVCWFPRDILDTPGGEDFLRQSTNEKRTDERKRGRLRSLWEVISSEIGNHHWDVWIYARAIADMVVGGEWDARRWPWIQRAAPAVEEAVEGSGLRVESRGQEDFAAR